jgi:hypothetical protein
MAMLLSRGDISFYINHSIGKWQAKLIMCILVNKEEENARFP